MPRKSEVKSRKVSDASERSGGVVYVGHLPHGFYEDQITRYCSQFGMVKGVRVARSKKTGRCKGFGFIEFECDEVAKIMADTMNNYLMFDKLLKCEYIEPAQVHSGMLVRNGPTITSEISRGYRLHKARRRHNKAKTMSQYKKNLKRLVQAENKKRKKLASLGVDYEFPGYRSEVQSGSSHSAIPSHIVFED